MYHRFTLIETFILAVALFGCLRLHSQSSTVKNVVLVHGAWVDGSGWKPVYDILTRDGFHVAIVQEPLTSFAADVMATRRILDMQSGPSVLVGHSYGGSVITQAGVDAHVAALVYVAAHMPDVGESEAADGKRFPSDLAKSSYVRKTPDNFNYLDPTAFPAYFAADLPREQAAFEAHSQMLTAIANFAGTISTPAWRQKPSWMIVAASDRIINPDLERWYAKRANSHTSEIPGASHSVYESHPTEVAAVIEQAARAASHQ
jgi:pimeloyl-ACP methyl ester carboxylesterase